MLTNVDIQARKDAGRLAAQDEQATEHKPVGNTSPENFPYTYWYVIGYNEYVDEQS